MWLVTSEDTHALGSFQQLVTNRAFQDPSYDISTARPLLNIWCAVHLWPGIRHWTAPGKASQSPGLFLWPLPLQCLGRNSCTWVSQCSGPSYQSLPSASLAGGVLQELLYQPGVIRHKATCYKFPEVYHNPLYPLHRPPHFYNTVLGKVLWTSLHYLFLFLSCLLPETRFHSGWHYSAPADELHQN